MKGKLARLAEKRSLEVNEKVTPRGQNTQVLSRTKAIPNVAVAAAIVADCPARRRLLAVRDYGIRAAPDGSG